MPEDFISDTVVMEDGDKSNNNKDDNDDVDEYNDDNNSVKNHDVRNSGEDEDDNWMTSAGKL